MTKVKSFNDVMKDKINTLIKDATENNYITSASLFDDKSKKIINGVMMKLTTYNLLDGKDIPYYCISSIMMLNRNEKCLGDITLADAVKYVIYNIYLADSDDRCVGLLQIKLVVNSHFDDEIVTYYNIVLPDENGTGAFKELI